MLRPRVICLAATLVAGASLFAPVPAAPQSALDPGELRPSVSGQSDGTELGQASGPTPGPPGSTSLLGPPLYGAPPSPAAA